MIEPFFKVERVRSPKHLAWIRTLWCAIPGCPHRFVIAHHLTCGPEPKARGLKASDINALNLCEILHHSAQSDEGVHHAGNEAQWWADRGIDPIAHTLMLVQWSPAFGGDGRIPRHGRAMVSRGMGLLPKEQEQ